MPLAKCARCGAMFEKHQSAVCVKCQSAEDEDYEKVQNVIEKKPNMNAEQVADAAEVDLAVVSRMLDEGRLENVTLDANVKCGRCGAPAISRSKRLCNACLEALNAKTARAQASIKLGKKKQTEIGAYNMSARKALEEKRKKQ
jgi:ribosomal protein L37E